MPPTPDHPDRCPFLIQIPVPRSDRTYPYRCKLRVGHVQPHDSVVLTRGERQMYAAMLRVRAEGEAHAK